ncbi:MAG TPA: caspase family protein [Phycisphaerae bacterium]|nr:caspase family protein [Phycisphaerae bacterium]
MRRTFVLAAILLCSASVALAAEPSASTAGAAGERWALLIGINEYQAAGKLQFCREDAQALGKVLVERGGFNPDRVVVLADGEAKPEDWPTRGNIRRRIEQFSRLAEPDDTVVVFFSGHGMMADGKGYLMAVDSDRDPANSISLDWVKERLAAGKAKTKLLVLDVCHAGSAKDVGGLAPSLVGIAGLTVLASCAADEISYVEEEAQSGVFAGRLVEGLAGAADADGDKAVTIAELHAFVKRSMKDWCLKTGKTQTPSLHPDPAPALTLAHAGQMWARWPVTSTDSGLTETVNEFRTTVLAKVMECGLSNLQIAKLGAIQRRYETELEARTRAAEEIHSKCDDSESDSPLWAMYYGALIRISNTKEKCFMEVISILTVPQFERLCAALEAYEVFRRYSEIRLTDGQRETIREIITSELRGTFIEVPNSMDALKEIYNRQKSNIDNRIREAIFSVLTEEQRAKLDSQTLKRLRQ